MVRRITCAAIHLERGASDRRRSPAPRRGSRRRRDREIATPISSWRRRRSRGSGWYVAPARVAT